VGGGPKPGRNSFSEELGAGLQPEVTSSLCKGSLLKLDAFSNNSFDPCLQISLAVQSCKKCSALRETSGQPDCSLFPRDMHRSLPRGIVLSLGNYSVINFLFRERTRATSLDGGRGALARTCCRWLGFLHIGQPVMILTTPPGFN